MSGGSELLQSFRVIVNFDVSLAFIGFLLPFTQDLYYIRIEEFENEEEMRICEKLLWQWPKAVWAKPPPL